MKYHFRITYNIFSLLALLASVLGSAMTVTPAYAATFTVTTTSNNGLGSLRQVLSDAPGGSTITFDDSLSGTTIFLAAPLDIVKKLTIDGSMLATKITISGDSDGNGNGDVAVFTNSAGTLGDSVKLDGLNITLGRALNPLDSGGGIFNTGFLSVSNCILVDNIATSSGGAIYNSGTLTVTNSAFFNNIAQTGGGGIYNDGILYVTSSTLSGNRTMYAAVTGASSGGGIYNSGILSVTNSTLSGNLATDDGGGIYSSDTLTVINSTFSINRAISVGGGFYLLGGGTARVSNSTINNNTSDFSAGGIGNAGNLALINSTLTGNLANLDGGAIFNNGTGQVNVYNSTIVYNMADADADINGGQAGGVYNTGAFNMRNTLLAGNSVSGAPVYNDCSGTISSYGRNLIGAPYNDTSGSCTVITGTGTWAQLNDLNLLGILQDNGGPTKTVALLPGSNAIDQGDLAFGCLGPDASSLATDQRGVARPQGARCDIGAYELRPDGNDTAGVFRPSNGLLYLKNANTTGFADVSINYGTAGDYPIAGDWDGNGTATIGIYRNGSFYLRNSNTLGFADLVIPFGTPGDQPVVGDWNGDGVDTIGVYSNGQFLLRNSNSAGTADMNFYLGNPGDVGIAGDWNGDGLDTTGVFRPSNGVIFLKNLNTTGFADIAINYGLAGDKPVTGDWNNDGIDTIGVYRNAQFLLRNSNTIGFAEIVFGLGNPGDMPISGNWDGIP